METHYHAGYNMVGYLPEMDPGTFTEWEYVKGYMLEELRLSADSVQSWVDKHDCDDIPCPTYGDSCGWNLAENLSSKAEYLNLDNGPEWRTIVGNMSYWINACQDEACELEEDDYS